jgi:hypothetical protein
MEALSHFLPALATPVCVHFCAGAVRRGTLERGTQGIVEEAAPAPQGEASEGAAADGGVAEEEDPEAVVAEGGAEEEAVARQEPVVSPTLALPPGWSRSADSSFQPPADLLGRGAVAQSSLAAAWREHHACSARHDGWPGPRRSSRSSAGVPPP